MDNLFNQRKEGQMKVKIKLSDFNDACIKDVIYNGYVEVEAEPIECQHEWIQYERIKHPICDIIEYCPKCHKVKEKMSQGEAIEESIPEWVENFYRLSDDNKMLVLITSNSLLNGHEMIIEFFKQTLKEFAKDYGYMGWNVIEKKYGIED